MESRIKFKKPIKFGKLLTVTKLSVSNETIQSYGENIKKQDPNISEDDLHEEITRLVKKDNFYNSLMDEVASAYEFELNEEEVQQRMKILKEGYPKASDQNIREMVEISIYKKLIYDDLAKDWEIDISDEDVRSTLENFYKSTGQPIREYLVNKDKFEEVRNTLQEQLISDRLLNAFAVEYKLEGE